MSHSFNPVADRTHLLRGVAHRHEKNIFVLWREWHGGKDKLIDFSRLQWVGVCFRRVNLRLERGYQTVERHDPFRRQVSFKSGYHDKCAVDLRRVLIMLCLAASFGGEAREIPAPRFDDKLTAIGRVDNEIGSEPADRFFRREL